MAFSHLARALDVEWFLSRDKAREAEQLEQEDRRLIGSASSLATAMDGWLEGRRAALQHRTLGTRVAELLTVAHLILIVVSLFVGSATAEALLFSTAPLHPTNLLTFLFATLVWPFALLSLSLLWIGLRRRVDAPMLLAEFYAIVVGALTRVGQRATEDSWSVVTEWRNVRRQQHRYVRLELATFAAASQWYALCFHLGAALSLLRLALFSDLTFAWSTTAQALEWDALAKFFSVITAPWCRTTGVGCVPSELVRATEFVRFTGEYAQANGAALSGAWWSPLFLCLIAYGVTPRFVAFSLLARQATRYAASLRDDHVDLRRRLVRGVGVTKHRAGAQADGAPVAPAVALAQVASHDLGSPCWLIYWRGAELAKSAEQEYVAELGYRVGRRNSAGGTDFEHDQAIVRKPENIETEPVLLVADGWEAPDKATRRFIQSIREAGATERPIYVLVTTTAADDHSAAIWKDRLALLRDPYLHVQSIAQGPTADATQREHHL